MSDYSFNSQMNNSGWLAYGVKGNRFYEIYLIRKSKDQKYIEYDCYHFYKDFSYKCDGGFCHYMDLMNKNGGRNRIKNKLMKAMASTHQCAGCEYTINIENDQHVYCPVCVDYYCYDCMIHKRKSINHTSIAYEISEDKVESFALND